MSDYSAFFLMKPEDVKRYAVEVLHFFQPEEETDCVEIGDGNINYVFASFDLDAFGVADAKFDELAASKVVAASILTGIGLDNAVVDSAQLTITGNPQAVISRDTSGQEVAEFSGTTNIEGVPSTWKVTETYDHTAGVTLGDNSVIRTLSVDLR